MCVNATQSQLCVQSSIFEAGGNTPFGIEMNPLIIHYKEKSAAFTNATIPSHCIHFGPFHVNV